MMLESLPVEIITDIFKKLEPTEILNSGLVNLRLAEIAARILPKFRALKIGISTGSWSGNCSGDEATLQLSQIDNHDTEEILKVLMPVLVKALQSIHLENEMINGEITDDQLSRLLNFSKDSPIKELALSEIDFKQFRVWTLALFAGFNQLEKIEIEGCKLGGDTEAKLLRCLQSSFQTLTQINLKGTPEVTDNFARRISRSCRNLAFFRISDCPRVTTLSALPLIESASYRRTDKLDVHMDNTDFDANQLQNYMRSPLFGSTSSEWSLEPVVVPLGYDKPAVLALHSSRKCVLIFV